MVAKRVATNFRMPREIYEKLRKVAFELRVSMNSLIVKALDKYLKEK